MNLKFENTDNNNSDACLELATDQYNVIWQAGDPSIFELHRQYQKGNIDVQPEFQRYYVWDDKRASLLIESVLLNLPIPSLYLVEEADEKLSIIDGQQRLTSFFKFLDNEFKLKGLHVFKNLRNKYFKDLSEGIQTKIENTKIHIINIKKESDNDIKFEIFERLNTGSVKLNDDELRNCIYRGKYILLIKDLAENQDFQYLLGLKAPDRRMRDRGLILQFFAFYRQVYLNYKPPIKQFLNHELLHNRDLDDGLAKEYRQIFKQAVDIAKTVFGDKAFRRFSPGNNKDANGQWELNKPNKALFQIIMYGFTQYPKSQIIPKADIIREELIHLMTHDQEFINAISMSTGKTAHVRVRFKKWLDILEKIVGLPHKETRNFSYSLKKQLFENNPTCDLCEQRISLIDDAEVDHIQHYWRGGQTIPANARLVHRYCNRQRGGRE